RTPPPGDGADALAGNDDPHQVQRIRGRDDDAFAIRVLRQLAVGAQTFDCYRKRELLSEKSIDEAPAAHFAAVFQAAVTDLQFPPAWQIRFPCQQVAEDYAIAPQQHPAARLDARVALGAFGVQQRPAPRRMTRAAR